MVGRFFINTILVLAIIVLGLGAFEAGVRMTMPQELTRGYVRTDPDLGYSIAPNAVYVDPYSREGPYRVRTNAHGFRMEEEVDLSPERLRVLVYGDGSAFGWGLEYADTYFAALKAAAEKADPAVQLLNAGFENYSTGHVKKLLDRHIPAIEPAAVIYFIGSDDLARNMITDIDDRVTDFTIDEAGAVLLTDVQPFAPWKRGLLEHTPYAWLSRNSHLFILAKDRMLGVLGRKESIDETATGTTESDRGVDETVAVTSAHVKRLIDIAREARLPLMAVWVPADAEMFGDDAAVLERKLFDQARREITRLAKSTRGFFFIDTTERIPSGRGWAKRKGTLLLSDGHFNREGAQWYADLVRPPVLGFLKGVGWTRRKKN